MRAAGRLVHDLGRVGVPVRVWQATAPLSADDREKGDSTRTTPSGSCPASPLLAELAPIADATTSGSTAPATTAALPPPELALAARLLAAADAYRR